MSDLDVSVCRFVAFVGSVLSFVAWWAGNASLASDIAIGTIGAVVAFAVLPPIGNALHKWAIKHSVDGDDYEQKRG